MTAVKRLVPEYNLRYDLLLGRLNRGQKQLKRMWVLDLSVRHHFLNIVF